MKKTTKIGLAMWIGLLLVVIVWMFSDEKGKEKSKIEHAETWQHVKKFYHRHIPGLKREGKLGLTRKYDKLQINVQNRRISIHELWYSSEDVYLLYSINDLKEEHPPYLTGSIADQNGNKQFGIMVQVPIHTIKYKNQFYNFLKFSPIYTEKTNEIVKQLDKLILKDLAVIYFKNKSESDQELTIPQSIKLNINYDVNNEINKTIHLNKTVHLMDHKIKLVKMIIGVSKNLLFIEHLTPEKGNLYDLRVNLIHNSQTENVSQFPKEQGGHIYTLNFEPFNEYPKQFNFEIQFLSYISNKSIFTELDLTTLNLNQEEITLKKKLGSVFNNTVTLNRILVEEDRIITEFLRTKTKKEEPYKQIYLDSTLLSPSGIVQEFGPYSSFISIKNEKDVLLKDIHGGYGSSDGSLLGVGISKDFIQSSKGIYFTLKNIPVKINGEWSVSIDNIRKK